jgi:hypothetical protein
VFKSHLHVRFQNAFLLYIFTVYKFDKLIVLKMQTKVHFKIGHVNDTLLEQNMFVLYHAKVMCLLLADFFNLI